MLDRIQAGDEVDGDQEEKPKKRRSISSGKRKKRQDSTDGASSHRDHGDEGSSQHRDRSDNFPTTSSHYFSNDDIDGSSNAGHSRQGSRLPTLEADNFEPRVSKNPKIQEKKQENIAKAAAASSKGLPPFLRVNKINATVQKRLSLAHTRTKRRRMIGSARAPQNAFSAGDAFGAALKRKMEENVRTFLSSESDSD